MLPATTPHPLCSWHEAQVQFLKAKSDGTGKPQPPASLALCSATAPARSPNPVTLTALPTMLICLIKSWLIDRDGIQLLMTNHYMNRDVRNFYRVSQRALPQHSAALISGHRKSVQTVPDHDGELLWFRPNLEQAQNPKLLEIETAEAAYAMGGKFMTAANRNVLLRYILCSAKTSSPERMGAMIQSLCNALGGGISKSQHHYAVLDQILACAKTSTSDQMGEMIQALCCGLGGVNMAKGVRTHVTGKILASHNTSSSTQIFSMLHAACLALGGDAITPEKRDGLLHQVLAQYRINRKLPLVQMMFALCAGFGGANMGWANLNAILANIMACSKTCRSDEMASMIESLCSVLGGKDMAASLTAYVVKKIMDSHQTVSPSQMLAMIYWVCMSVGGATMTSEHRSAIVVTILDFYNTYAQPRPELILGALCRGLSDTLLKPTDKRDRAVKKNDLTRANGDAVLAQILSHQDQWSSHKMAEAVTTLCISLGGVNMSPATRDRVLAAILACYVTSPAPMMGAMIWGLCFTVCGGAEPGPGTPKRTALTVGNLNAVISQILNTDKTTGPLMTGTMIYCVVIALRRTGFKLAHRDAIVARIRESGRVKEIIAALKLPERGQEVLEFLQLDTARAK